jgi:hypothetical protein
MSEEIASVQFNEVNDTQSEAQALADLIARSEQKLANLQVQNLVYENNRHEQALIDGSRAAIAQITTTIAKIEEQAVQVLESIESAIDEQLNTAPAMGQFGIPVAAPSSKSVTALGATYAGLRLNAAQQRKQRAVMQQRLDDLLRVQAQHVVRPT